MNDLNRQNKFEKKNLKTSLPDLKISIELHNYNSLVLVQGYKPVE